MGKIRNKITDNVGVRKRVDLDILAIVGNTAKARKVVLAVDVHGAATADTFTATPPEDEGGVLLVLDLEEGVENHLTGLVEVELVVLKVRLLGGVVGVPAVNLEGLHPLGLLGLGRFADGSHGAGKHGSRGPKGRGTSSGGNLGAEHPGRAKSRHCVGVLREEREGRVGGEERVVRGEARVFSLGPLELGRMDIPWQQRAIEGFGNADMPVYHGGEAGGGRK